VRYQRLRANTPQSRTNKSELLSRRSHPVSRRINRY
jgi:hypothetical protein